MDPYGIVLISIWFCFGLVLVVGELKWFKRIRIANVFGTENRWGKVTYGLVIMAVTTKAFFNEIARGTV